MKIVQTVGESDVAKAFKEPLSLEGEIEYCKLILVEELLRHMKRQRITKKEIAERMGVVPARITKILNGTENLTIETLVRAGMAIGARFKGGFYPIAKTALAGGKSRKEAENE